MRRTGRLAARMVVSAGGARPATAHAISSIDVGNLATLIEDNSDAATAWR